MDTFYINNIENVDSPSLLLYDENLQHNLELMISMVKGRTELLMPHIKTVKMPKVVERMVSLGIFQFKTATIVEAEIAAMARAKNVLISHQLVGSKIKRFMTLIKKYPEVQFSTIVDNQASIDLLNYCAKAEKLRISIYIDINNGMDRSGIKPGQGLEGLISYLKNKEALSFSGFHVYDGHLRDNEFTVRNSKVEDAIQSIEKLFQLLLKENPKLKMICGGTPTFTSHLVSENRICSPGTCTLWDWGYSEKLKEQEFKFAALLVTRVISKPTEGIITIDLGHKSVAAENAIDNRVKFLNLKNYKLISQSEEHGVVQVKDWKILRVGDVLYGVPYHICPTINLHDYVSVVVNGNVEDRWEIVRTR